MKPITLILSLTFVLSSNVAMANLSRLETSTLLKLAKKYCINPSAAADLSDLPECSKIMNDKECLMFNYMNTFRSYCQLPTFTASRACTLSAKEHSNYMGKSGNFAHASTGVMWTRLEKHGAKPRRISENIAMQSTNFTPLRAMKRLVLSQGHRRNLINHKSQFAGVGLAYGQMRKMTIRYWTQCFYGQ